MDAAALGRIGAAFRALEAELVAAGIPPAAVEDVIILLAVRRRDERTRPEREARIRRIAAQRAAAATSECNGRRGGTRVDLDSITGPGGAR